MATSGREGDVGHALRPQREAQQRPHGCELPGQRRGGEAPWAAAAELGRVVREHTGVDVVQGHALSLQPVYERLEVEAVRPPCGLTETGRVEKALHLGARVHEACFVPGVASPATRRRPPPGRGDSHSDSHCDCHWTG